MSANTNADVAAMVELAQRLRMKLLSPHGGTGYPANTYYNRDGPEAAALIQSQQAEIERVNQLALDGVNRGIATGLEMAEAEITRLSAMVEEKDAALRKIVAPYDRDGCMTGERYSDAIWIAKAAISTQEPTP